MNHGPFTRLGATLDRGLEWVYGRYESSIRGKLHSKEFKRILANGAAVGLAWATPAITRAVASSSKSEILAAMYQGVLTGAGATTASVLHRLYDGEETVPIPPPPPGPAGPPP